MSNLLQPLSAESSSHSGRGLCGPSSSSAAAALGIPHEVRLKLAKRMRQEQLRLYQEREARLEETREFRCKDGGGSSEAQDGGEESKMKKGRMVAFGSKELILDAAQKSDREEVLRMLSENLACPNTTSKATGSSLLHLCSLNNDLPSLQVLLEHGADVNIQDYDLWTPLHVAAACGHTSIAEVLLEYDADTTLLDVDGNFAYDSADNDDLKELLLKHMSFKGIYEQDLRSLRSRQAKAMLAAVKDCVSRNKNLNLLNKNGVALLHIAAANGYYKIAKLLLDGGADVDVSDDLGYTPLHVAAKFEQLKVVKLLLKRSADPNAKSGQLELPVDLCDSDEITELLTQAGGEQKASKLPEVYAPVGGTFVLPAPLSPVTLTIPPPSPTPGNDSGVDTNEPPLTPTQIQSVNINFDEFDLARNTSRILNRTIPLSKLEAFFEAETLIERDKFDEGTDVSTQAPALRRLHGRILQRRQTEKLELPDPGATDNLATLSDLTEDIVVRYLKERYQRDQIYTFIGEILVAVNPFKSLPFYSNLASEQYSDNSINSTLPPHIFAVADQVFKDMMAEKRSQSCVISGESGAGKTETSKLFTQHLLYVASSEETELSIKIEQVSPVLEAFGNAKTVMNNNSSRFGKYLELLFSYEGAILGGCFKEYLLEKSRVVVQGCNERNFHIFYQMFAGLTDEQKEELNLGNPDSHRCLVGSGEPLDEVITPELGKSFLEVCDSLQAIGFSDKDQDSLLHCLASVLHICDLCFVTDEEGSTISNPKKVEVVADLLEVDQNELAACLIQEATITRGEEIVRRRSIVLANDCRDALAKALYGRMFGWIVNGVNHHLQPEDVEPTHPLRIGILDIFGFENFEKNSFEQMCINIANEQLQYFFNEYIFKWEQEECACEGVATETICYQSNWPVVDLFLGKSTGLLALIDEESRFPRATDRSLAAKMHKVHHRGQASSTETDDRVYRAPPDKGAKFGINHYAGYVEYDVIGFLDKNRDTLPPSIQMLMKTSGSLLIREIFGAKLTRTGTIAPSMRQRMSRVAESPFSHFNRKTSKRLSTARASMARKNAQRSPLRGRKFDTGRRAPPTVSNHFRNSLAELMEKLNSSKPRFIRCIKPNADKLPDTYISSYIQKQLRYTGVMETARIRQCGFPTRLTFDDFCKRYWILRELYVPQLSCYEPPTGPEGAAHQILERVGITGWVHGRTKVMLKYNHTTELEKHMNSVYVKIVTIQRCFRDRQARRMMQELIQVKQKQAIFVKYLLESATYHGLIYFRELERLNHQDKVRNIERLKNRADQQVSSLESYSHCSTSPQDSAQGYTMYARVTKSKNINNNANIPTDDLEICDHQLTAAKVPVYRIRSLPQSGMDDTIMITNPNSPRTVQHKDGGSNAQSQDVTGHSPVPYSRRHAPLPPVPAHCDVDSVYSLAQDVPPTRSPGRRPLSVYSRQNAPLPPPPETVLSPTAEFTNSRHVTSQSDKQAGFDDSGQRQTSYPSQPEYQDDTEEIYDDATSKASPTDSSYLGATLSQHPPVRKVTSSHSPPEKRKYTPLPPLPPSANSTETEKQTVFIKQVDDEAASSVNKCLPKQQLPMSQPHRSSHDSSKLSASQQSHRSKSPSPSFIQTESPGKTFTPTPSPPPPQVREQIRTNSTSPYHSPSSNKINTSTHHRLSSVNTDDSNEEAPPPPPPRKTSAPAGSPLPPTRKTSSESVSEVPNLPPVPLRKTSEGNSIVEPEAPPLPSRRITETHESGGMVHSPIHRAMQLDSNEPIAPPLPSRKIIQQPGGAVSSRRPERRNAVRTPSSESLKSLPEHEPSTHLFSRAGMQRKLKGLLGPPISRSRALSNEFSTHCAKPKLGQRLSDPSSRVGNNRSHVPIHKTPLPPIPVQMHTSTSSPQLQDVPQDVYEDLDKALESINQDVAQLDYEDIDMDLDKPQDHYEDIDDSDNDNPQNYYQDIDADKPQDHYEDIDYDSEDRPQEVYEDINNDDAQRVSFAKTAASPQGYTPPISRRSVAVNGFDEPEDYTPPITRKSVQYVEDDEPQDYTPPIRRRGGADTNNMEEEPEEYTAPIRRSRVFAEEDGPQDYSPPIRRSRGYNDDEEHHNITSGRRDRLNEQTDPSQPPPPLPPRFSSQQQRNQRSAPVTPVSNRDRPPSTGSNEKKQPTSRGQQSPQSSRSRPTATRTPNPSSTNRPLVDSAPKANVVGVPVPPQTPPIGGAPPPPPPPSIGFRSSHSVQPTSSGSGDSQSHVPTPSSETPSSLQDGIANVQLKKASERKIPQKAPPTSSSGSTVSTNSLFAEMQSLQLRKTKKPTGEASSPQPRTSAPTVPVHSPLRRTQNHTTQPPSQPTNTQPPNRPAPRPAVRPKPSKPQPPSIKPKPSHLLSPKHDVQTPPSLNASNGIVSQSRNRLGVR